MIRVQWHIGIRNRNRYCSRIIEYDFVAFSKIYNHTIVIGPILYIGEFYCHTDISVLQDQKG